MGFHCDWCHGTGEVDEIDVDCACYRTTRETCPECDGSGWLKPGSPAYERTCERFMREALGLKHEIERRLGSKPN